MLEPETLWDRIAGSLHGLLVGDALGCPVEGWTPEQIRTQYGRLDDMIEGVGRRWRPRGLHSDDGQQALAVLDAICTDPEQPEVPFIELMVALRDAAPQRSGRWGLHRGVGRNFRHTIRGLQATGSSKPHAHASKSAGNGAAMRIASVALWWRDQPVVRDRRVVQISGVTHADLRGISAAHALASAISTSLVPKPGAVLNSRLVTAVERAEARTLELLELEHDRRNSEMLTSVVEARRHSYGLAQLLDHIESKAVSVAGADQPVKATDSFAPCSVSTALAIVDFSDSFEQAMLTAINLGGDADTIGAMVGALAGARYGLEGIPSRWLDDLRATGTLVERIDRVHRQEPGAPRPDLVMLEKSWDALFEQRPAPHRRAQS